MRTGTRGAMVYAQAAASEPRQVLEQIDELLASLGSSKSKLLTARVLLSNADLFPDYDNAWSQWLAPLHGQKPHEAFIDVTVTARK